MWVPLKQKLRRAREMLPEGIENGVRKRGGWKAEYCKNVIHGMVLGGLGLVLLGALCHASEFVLNQGHVSGLTHFPISPCLRGDHRRQVLPDYCSYEWHVVGALLDNQS